MKEMFESVTFLFSVFFFIGLCIFAKVSDVKTPDMGKTDSEVVVNPFSYSA